MDDPSKGAIYLHDGQLTVLQIAGLRLQHAEAAFLSACQTAIGGVRLLDEAIHLAAALQLAGYRHVIATLWWISDEHAPEIADAVYRQVTETGTPDANRIAQALHHAVRQLRRTHHDRPTIWASHLHIGP